MSRAKRGTPAGELATMRWRKTMLERFGTKEAYCEFMREQGRKGGTNGRGKNYGGGFSSTKVGADGLTGKERAVIAGSKGGKLSKRGKAKKNKEQ